MQNRSMWGAWSEAGQRTLEVPSTPLQPKTTSAAGSRAHVFISEMVNNIHKITQRCRQAGYNQHLLSTCVPGRRATCCV